MNQALKRVIILALSLFLVAYVVFQAYHAFGPTMTIEPVELVTTYHTVDTTGLVFRDEVVVGKEGDGYFFYTVADGNRVAKKGTIANVFPTLQDALGQQQLDLLDKEIELLESINAQGTSNRANLTSINRQIAENWLTLSVAAQSGVYGDLTETRSRLLSLLNKKQLTIGRETDFNDRLASLRAQRAAVKTAFTPATSTVSAPVAGYFVSRTDGFETLLTTKGVTDLTTGQIRDYLAAEPTVGGGHIGKVVGDYEWYLACVVPLEETALIKAGTSLSVRLPFVMNEAVPMKVVAINKSSDDTAAIILQCTHMSGELSAIRKEQVELRLTSYNGLRIPDEAIHFNEQNEPGVFVQDGNYLSFRKIRVVYHNAKDGYSLCENTVKSGYVQLHDRIVTKGDDLYDGKPVK